MITIKTEEEIKIMKTGGKILSSIIKEVASKVKPGVTTDYLNKVAEDLVFKYGCKPSFKNFGGFPGALCTSVNDELVHVPSSSRKLLNGDIITLDLGVEYKGYHTDMAITVPVGEIDEEKSRLIRVTKKALKRGIKKVRPGITLGDVGNTIQRYIEDQGYSVVRDLCGHGIGKQVHEDPQILNYGKRGSGPRIKEGMVFCIEPIVSAGDWRIRKTGDSTGYRTNDGSLSAHFEHTMVVTKEGCEVITD